MNNPMISHASNPSALPTISRATPSYLSNIATFVLVDYLSLTGPSETFATARRALETTFGTLESTGHPVGLYADQHCSPDYPRGSCQIMETHSTNSAWLINLKGEPLQTLGHDGLVDFLCSLPHEGLASTRIDCTIDLKAEDSPQLENLIGDFDDDCATEVVNPRRRRRLVTDLDGRKLYGNGIYHGTDASRCVLCIYDKGLESSKGKDPAGKWLRWEARYFKDKADAVFKSLMEEPTPERVAALSRGIVASIYGKTSWILDVLSATSLSPPPERPTPDLPGYIDWLRESLKRVCAISERSGLSPEQVLREFGVFDAVAISNDVKNHPVVAQACNYLSEHVISRTHHDEIH